MSSSSSMIVVPNTTQGPPTFFVVASLTMKWKDFCGETANEFRQGIAKLLAEKLNINFYSSQVIIFNDNNCQTNPEESATVKFYISKSNATLASSLSWTEVADQIIKDLLKEGNTVMIGASFGEGAVSNQQTKIYQLMIKLGSFSFLFRTLL